MPNLDLPVGAEPKGQPLRINEYVASGVIYPGDLVSLEAGGRVSAAVATAAVCGVAAGYASGAGEKVLVWDHPDQLFIMQADETEVDAQTDINLNYDLTATAGDATYRVSRQELDSSTGATTATLPLKLVGVLPRVGEALGAQAKCVVKINNHQFASHTGTAGV